MFVGEVEDDLIEASFGGRHGSFQEVRVIGVEKHRMFIFITSGSHQG